jgi:hypothetical protein
VNGWGSHIAGLGGEQVLPSNVFLGEMTNLVSLCVTYRVGVGRG